jgi:hypothetical protein
MKKLKLFTGGLLAGLTTLSLGIASVPKHGRVTDDTALYQRLSEIRVSREIEQNFDSDVSRLSKLESRYSEKLPALARNPRVAAPMKRIAAQKYRFSGKSQSVSRN